MVMIIFIAIIHLSKRVAKSLNYSYLLAILNALFLVVFFPQPIHLIIFIVYAWLLTYWLISKMKPQKKIWGIILLLAPMLFVKANIRFHHYPFELNHLLSFAGLSYTSFRIVGNYMDMANGSPMIPFLQYFNFLSFTPTLLIGPIEKFSRFQNTVSLALTNLNADYFLSGWHAFLKGFTFKFILAEIVDRYWLGFFDQSDQSIASIRPPWPWALLCTRLTATVTISQALAAMLCCKASMLGYLPVPVIKRLLNSRPPISSGSAVVIMLLFCMAGGQNGSRAGGAIVIYGG
jgi:D-alanyl-lipoteichoic acid acyltransferase DltB (MBOAT superfamily)